MSARIALRGRNLLNCCLIVLLAAGIVTSAGASERLAGQNITVPAERTIADDLTVAGSNLLIQGPVQGDVIAAGANVAVSGPVAGDGLLAGATVTVSGPISDDLRAMGGTVTVTAPVGDNLSLAGSTIVLGTDVRVSRDAALAGASVTLRGNVGRNLLLAASNAEITGTVNGDVQARTERLVLGPGAVVRGDLVVYSPTPPVISPEARVLGRMVHQPAQAGQQRPSAGEQVANWFGSWLLQFLWVFILGSLLIALTPNTTERVAATMVSRVGPTLATGCGGCVLIPLAAFLLIVTIVALPIGFILLVTYVALLVLAGVYVAYRVGKWVGDWLARRQGRSEISPYVKMALGALIVTFLTSLPIAGPVFQVLVTLVGLGALLLERRDLLVRMRAEGVA